MLRHLTLFMTGLLLALPAAAQKNVVKPERNTAAELRQKAVEESRASGISKKVSTDAQVSGEGLMSLRDPGLNPQVSPWRWMMGVRLENFEPKGRTTMRNGQILDLSTVGATNYPMIELGLDRTAYQNETVTIGLGLRGEAGYTNQRTEVTFPAGAQVEGSRLATSIAGGALVASARFSRFSRFQLEAGFGEGVLTYSHSAPNNSANTTDSARYTNLRTGLLYWPATDWALGIEHAQRDISGEEIGLSTGELSFSARATW